MNDLVSVIIPSYNHGQYVEETIMSVINQSHKNIELIIIDDCSTDKTDEIINSFKNDCEKRFVRFLYIKKEKNMGVVDSVNKLIDIANGEYILGVASDDVLKPQLIERLLNFIKDEPEYAFVGGDTELIDSNSNRVYWTKNMEITQDLNKAEYKTWGDYSKMVAKKISNIELNSEDFGSYKSILKNNYITNGFILRKSAILEVGKYKNCVFEDWYMHLQLSKKYKFKYIDEILFSYRLHPQNSIKNEIYSTPRYYTTFAYEKKYCEEHGLKDLWSELFNKYSPGEVEEKFIDSYFNEKNLEEIDLELLMDTVNVILEKSQKIEILKQDLQKYSKKKFRFISKILNHLRKK